MAKYSQEFKLEVINYYLSGQGGVKSTAKRFETHINMLMATWLFDSLFCGITKAQYLESDMQFIISHDGVVTHKRVSSSHSS